ncbi:hypothetical protein [Vibrio bivalvicida]|uniref:Uncharacterized protein n=1 Tax=Vibrio bivalvicida TaxID=1276888 RepID=A0ABV4MDN3_9VIBR
METRVQEAIRCAQLLEIDVNDKNVRGCMVAAIMCEQVHESNLGTLLNLAYTSQSIVFLHALKQTEEFKLIHALLSKHLD